MGYGPATGSMEAAPESEVWSAYLCHTEVFGIILIELGNDGVGCSSLVSQGGSH